MIRLYDYILSADCYKVRLLCALLGVAYTPVKVNVHPGNEHLSADFVRINPRRSIPVLEDGDQRICDTNAILIHLARRHDPSGHWLPKDEDTFDRAMEWLGFSAKELDLLQALRMRSITAAGEPSPEELATAHSYLTIVEDHLAEGELIGRLWLAGQTPTIADIAVFAPTALAADGGVSLDRYPALWRWIDRVKRLNRFIVMPGVFPNLAGAV
jgi:glutathione S-transferase